MNIKSAFFYFNKKGFKRFNKPEPVSIDLQVLAMELSGFLKFLAQNF
jgi:hypothetical protein